MEYMNINSFLAQGASMVLNKGLKNKLGFDPKIEIEHLNATGLHEEGETEPSIVEVSCCLRMSVDKFNRLVWEVTQ